MPLICFVGTAGLFWALLLSLHELYYFYYYGSEPASTNHCHPTETPYPRNTAFHDPVDQHDGSLVDMGEPAQTRPIFPAEYVQGDWADGDHDEWVETALERSGRTGDGDKKHKFN